MTPEQKSLLTIHAKHYEDMLEFVMGCSDEELNTLMDACCAAGTTNCAWSTYEAAQYLKREAQTEMDQRMRCRSIQIA